MRAGLGPRLICSAAAVLAACTPVPRMPAAEARQAIERFAAGTQEFDVCTNAGRAVLRGAVRSYSAAEAEAGRMWPIVPNGENDAELFDSVNGSVLLAVAAGFVQVNDLRGEAQSAARMFALEYWPQMRDTRLAARLACRRWCNCSAPPRA